ncbi:cupin domain-containing protein [Gordonia sp. i37]|uniref:cupin domain-containing protein n=1 Tax=Gordonia sp. i37 TaxID=1961707 RepID=UPI0009AE1F45|nr:cupin domain-containing protein [Gordonia sp. i37]OPX14030.1 LuxR family transcriptional regulator [Gordonia sp. i37]
MDTSHLTSLVDQLIGTAHRSRSGRAAQTLHGDSSHRLRHTVIALVAGRELAEHESPAEGSVQVLHGRVTITAGDDVWKGRRGDLVMLPDARHRLSAQQDSAILLTVITG